MADGIDPDILQHALDHAIAQFPSFNVHLLNGMFWHYLEQSDGRPLVEPEHLPICSRLHYGPKSMLFRVSYFRNRVNLEVSHIISDGRGAINLFKSLLHAYIAERYDVPGVPSDYDGSDSDKAENSFDKYYEKDKAGAAPGTKIYRLAGPIDRAAPTFMEYHVSASKVLGAAHQCGVSLTSYLIAAILCAIRDVMPSRARNRAIRVDIPVDLRAFFRSETVRNFYGMTYVAYTPAEIEADEDSAKTSATSPDAAGDGQQSAARTAHGNGMGGLLTDEPLADISRHVQEQLGHATSRERVESHMNRMIALEKNPVLRLAPSPAKDWVLELARFIADRETTTTVSNLGRVTLDERLARHVRSVSFLTTPASLNFTVCSFGDDLSIGISTIYHDLNVIKNLCRILAAQGISGRMNIAGVHVEKGASA
nr:alcohol acetyltransferase [Bifidobacterium longum]